MAGPKDVTIRAQALDGTWQTMGGETARGLYPENVTLEADMWGSSTASFNLRRDPRAFFPDIGAFTPIEIDVGSSLVWSGRVRETPSQVAQRTINVQCEGWQFHLDDDLYNRTYVHSNISDWIDQRSLTITDLGTFKAAGQVNVGDGAVTLMLPTGSPTTAPFEIGVVLDLGAGQSARRISIDWDSSNNNGNTLLIVRGTDDGNPASTSDDAFTITQGGGTTGTSTGSFASPRRYVHAFFYNNVAGTPAIDIWWRLKGIRVFADPTYEFGNVSVLTASYVVVDAVSRSTQLLSSEISGIDPTSFAIPSYAPGWQTARQAWTAVDAYHDWLKQIDVNRRAVYKAKPTRPLFEVGAHSAIDDEDASANSGQEIYNNAVISATAAGGGSVSTTRVQGTSAQVQAYSGSGGVGGPGGSFALGFNTKFTFRKGVTYALRVKSLVISSFVAAGTLTSGRMGSGSGGPPWSAGDIVTYPNIALPGAGTYGPFDWVLWTPAADVSNPVGYSGSWSGDMHLDITFEATWGNTLVERRGFRRTMHLPINNALPSDGVAAGQIGDVWLTDHKTTPFRGSVTVTGDESVREIANGRDVGLEQLLLNTGQLIRFSDRSDPDTGGHGRDGRIAAVTYTPATNSAAVAIDNSRTSFDALLSRLAVVQGG